MAKTGWDVLKFQVTSVSATTTFHDISQYITDWSGLEILAELQESHALGDAWAEQAYANFRRMSPITFGGFYDDVAASGPHALFGNATDLGAERVAKLNFGTTNAYPKFDFLIRRYTRKPNRGQLTGYEVEILPTGAITVVTT